MKIGRFEISGFYAGDALDLCRELPDESIQCVVTSPPYWGLRDYGIEGQIGMEQSPEEYAERLVGIFRELRRALRGDGVFWLNIGDSHAGPQGRTGGKSGGGKGNEHGQRLPQSSKHLAKMSGLKPKDLIGIPWRVALALQADGWYLRSAIIWAKPNPMPESVRDRPTSSYEHIFLLSKSARYYYDADAIKEPAKEWGLRDRTNFRGGTTDPKLKHHGLRGKPKRAGRNNALDNPRTPDPRKKQDALGKRTYTDFNERHKDNPVETRNARDVWTIPTRPGAKTHFATFPPEIPRRCILAGSKQGDIVLDPFCGSGTTARVAEDLGRRWIGFDLSAEYIKQYCEPRLAQRGLFTKGDSDGEESKEARRDR